jgi:hypothetical protein
MEGWVVDPYRIVLHLSKRSARMQPKSRGVDITPRLVYVSSGKWLGRLVVYLQQAEFAPDREAGGMSFAAE